MHQCFHHLRMDFEADLQEENPSQLSLTASSLGDPKVQHGLP